MIVRLSLFAVVCAAAVGAPMLSGADDGNAEGPVSLVVLIVDPSKNAGRKVRVQGYLSRSAGVPMLFVTKDHSLMVDTASAYAVVDAGLDDCVGSYVALSATFRQSSVNDWEYVFADVERVIKLSPSGKAELCFG